jgi:hypothetical protein
MAFDKLALRIHNECSGALNSGLRAEDVQSAFNRAAQMIRRTTDQHAALDRQWTHTSSLRGHRT